MSSATRNFTFDGQHVFLTYPRSGDLSRERVRAFLLESLGVRRFLVARELHLDGEPHIHAYACWDTRRRFADARVFDVDGHHPNIQKPRSPKAVGEYCSKHDVEALRNFEISELESYSRGTGWRELLHECPDAATFLARVEEHYPRDLCLSLGKLLEFCEWRFGNKRREYSGRRRDEFLEPDELREWARMSLEEGGERPLSLLLCGASRLGKTQWARSLGPHMYMCGQFNLDDWDETAKYIVLDDFNIKFFPQWKSFFGAQECFVLSDKYRKKRTVTWGKTCIWLCNRDGDPRGVISGAELEWLRSNAVIYDLFSPLFTQ
ncbi:replication-associated protein [robinz virus RP_389]|nr:replication-associated protein [robinz virus RP_389]